MIVTWWPGPAEARNSIHTKLLMQPCNGILAGQLEAGSSLQEPHSSTVGWAKADSHLEYYPNLVEPWEYIPKGNNDFKIKNIYAATFAKGKKLVLEQTVQTHSQLEVITFYLHF